MELSWIDPAGIEHDLNRLPIRARLGLHGHRMAPQELTTVERPSGNGSVVRRVKRKVRDLDLALYLKASSAADFEELTGQVSGWFDTSRGPGRLRVTYTPGLIRELWLYYQTGLEATFDWKEQGPSWWVTIAHLLAVDPDWQDGLDTVYTFDLSAATAAFLGDPFLPLKISSSQILTSPTITNSGDFEAWPVWTITGPGSNIVLSNTATWPSTLAAETKLINFQGTLDSGAVVTIDTRPDYKVIHDAGGNGLRAYLSADSELWSLTPGKNAIQIQMDGAGGVSAIKLAYRRRWLGP